MIVNQVLLFEYISGGGMGNSADFEFLISEGFGMLSSLISDFLRLGFGIQVLIDERVVKRFTQKFNNEIQDQKIRFVVISNEKELPAGALAADRRSVQGARGDEKRRIPRQGKAIPFQSRRRWKRQCQTHHAQ